MTGLRVVIGSIWVVALVAGRGMWLSAPPSSIAATSAEITGPLENGYVPSAERRVDLFGNEVEEAVADYRLDVGGAIYERHSPETAVPKLGSPTS